MPALALAPVLGLGFPTRFSSFWTGSHGHGLHGSYSLHHPDPNRSAQRLLVNRRGQLGGCCGWNEPLQWFRSSRCNRSVDFGHFFPSRSAINSAPYSQTKTEPNIEISSLRSEVRSSLSDLKWLPTWSVHSATRFSKRLPRDFAKFVLKEGQKIQQIL